MIFNSEAEIEAYYQGRLSEADRWAWWKDGTKWCGVRPFRWTKKGPVLFNGNEVRSLQDIVAELQNEKEHVLELFRRNQHPVL